MEQIIREFCRDLGADILRSEARALLEDTFERLRLACADLELWAAPVDLANEIEVEPYLAEARAIVASARARNQPGRGVSMLSQTAWLPGMVSQLSDRKFWSSHVQKCV